MTTKKEKVKKENAKKEKEKAKKEKAKAKRVGSPPSERGDERDARALALENLRVQTQEREDAWRRAVRRHGQRLVARQAGGRAGGRCVWAGASERKACASRPACGRARTRIVHAPKLGEQRKAERAAMAQRGRGARPRARQDAPSAPRRRSAAAPPPPRREPQLGGCALKHHRRPRQRRPPSKTAKT
jgi:hypothetical protein